MKYLFSILISLFVLTSSYAQEKDVVRLSDPVTVTDTYEVFGTTVESWDDAASLSTVINAEEDFSGREVTIETEVTEVCQKKGCFLSLRMENKQPESPLKITAFLCLLIQKEKK